MLQKIRGLVSAFDPSAASQQQDAQEIVSAFGEAGKIISDIKLELATLSPCNKKSTTQKWSEHVSGLEAVRSKFLTKLSLSQKAKNVFVPIASLDESRGLDCKENGTKLSFESPLVGPESEGSGEFLSGEFVPSSDVSATDDQAAVVVEQKTKTEKAKHVFGSSFAVRRTPRVGGTSVRKRVSNLSAAEKTAFVNAVLELKQQPSLEGTTSRYDDFVAVHMHSMMPAPGTKGWAHQGPAFLPWHRVYLRQLEQELQEINPAVTIPYWDWTSRAAADFPLVASFLGGTGDSWDDYQVPTSNAFGNEERWPITVKVDNFEPDRLRREFDPTMISALPTASNVNTALSRSTYDTSPWNTSSQRSFRNTLEGWVGPGLHNAVHTWVGGTMSQMTSPNDPVFFLHHANCDRLWRRWQRTYPRSPYVPGDTASSSLRGHRLHDPMKPWEGLVTPASALDMLAMGYKYDDEPVWQAPSPGSFHLKDWKMPELPPGFKWPPAYGPLQSDETVSTSESETVSAKAGADAGTTTTANASTSTTTDSAA
jgi:tyrosinase